MDMLLIINTKTNLQRTLKNCFFFFVVSKYSVTFATKVKQLKNKGDENEN